MSCKHPRPYQTQLKTRKSSAAYFEICRTCGAGRTCLLTAAGVEYGNWEPPIKVELGTRQLGKCFAISIAADGSVVGCTTLRHGKGQKGDPPTWVTGRRIAIAEIPLSALAQLPEKLKEASAEPESTEAPAEPEANAA
jgi:hypothetical protein